MNNPLVTVVVPVYNVEKYLDRCIDSIVNQTYKNLEIILVDDGSPDNCPQMCDGWAKKDNRIKVIHKKNAGAGMARNTGLDNANGDYIFFIDSDDCVSTQIVEKCLLNAEKNNSDVVIFGRCDTFNDGRQISKDICIDKGVFQKKDIRNELISAMLNYKFGIGMSIWSKMYKVQTIKRLNKRFVSERELFSEDVYFGIDLFADIDTVTILKENLYYYLVRDNSLSRQFNINRHQTQNDYFYEKTIELARKKKLSNKVLEHIAVRYHMYSIANMKQIILADVNKKEKKKMFHLFFESDILLSTLTDDILRYENNSSKIFWKLFRKKRFLICYLLLYIKTKF